MNERTRRAFIVLPALITLGVVAVVGALVIVQDQRQAERVAAADVTAQDYLAKVASFKSDVASKVGAADTKEPAELARIVDSAASNPPVLPKASRYGMRASSTYAEAQMVEKTLLRPYRRLAGVLERAEEAKAFIEAARKALSVRASDYIGFDLIRSSAPIRANLIPAFVKAREEFESAAVPQGQQELADTVLDAVQYVINQATTLADRADAGQNYSFGYAEVFEKARVAVEDYATTVEGDVAEALAAVSTDP